MSLLYRFEKQIEGERKEDNQTNTFVLLNCFLSGGKLAFGVSQLFDCWAVCHIVVGSHP